MPQPTDNVQSCLPTTCLSIAALRQQLKATLPAYSSTQAVTSTGFAVLDDAFAQNGWPAGVTELLLATPASHEWLLLLPAMRALQAQGRWVAIVNPPAMPYAPGLQRQGLDLSRLVLLPTQSPDNCAWVCEQLLQSRSCGLLLAWFNPAKPQIVRRLQLLAKAHNSLFFLCRPLSALSQSSVAQARIEMQPALNGAQLHIHKIQGEIRRPELSLLWPKADVAYGA